jgi:cellulose synthase/poly-beta-1,6-N-acetylglucosamine synthase-like glycosyltransferase
MTIFFSIILFIAISGIVYVYFGYVGILYIVSKLKNKPVEKEDITPAVTIIITAYNEEKDIAKKIENTLRLDYPKNLLEIMVASDGSSDRTNDIVLSYADQGVILNCLKERKGKSSAQNDSVKKARGEIILFSDATTNYRNDALKKIVRNFADKSVGCVGGELHYINKKENSVGEGGGIYWRYEQNLKKLESSLGSLIGVSGCMYAVSKSLYSDIEPDAISDFVIAMHIVKSKHRVIYEPEAICEEYTEDNLKAEFRMRTRVANRSYRGLFSRKEMLNPFKYGFFSIQLISHKLLRYSVAFMMLSAFASNLFLIHILPFFILQTAQVMFYILALIGFIRQINNKNKKTIFFIPFYFCLLNFACLLAWKKFWKGKKDILWEPIRIN